MEASKCEAEIVQLLVEAGADKEAKDEVRRRGIYTHTHASAYNCVQIEKSM
jgi:hypothetical protein